MSEEEKIVVTVCPTCGRQMKVGVAAVNVYCTKCLKWAKVVPVNIENVGGKSSTQN